MITKKRILITVGVVVVVSASYMLFRTVSGRFAAQDDTLKKLTVQVEALQAGNPNLLNGCLDEASIAYSNAIKSTEGVILDPAGQPAYVTDRKAWDKVNNKLTQDRKTCHDKYGK